MKDEPRRWKCYAHPATLNGRECGHVNEKGVVYAGILCCEECGATKYASEARRGRRPEWETA